MTPTEHEKNEWSRMAAAAYLANRNGTGTKFSVAATLGTGQKMPLKMFDELMAEYCEWLAFGFPKEVQS